MGILEKLKNKMAGKLSPEEEEIKRKADARAAEYELLTGEAPVEEPGIEPDYTVEETASLINPVGIVKSGATKAAKAATTGSLKKTLLDKLKGMVPEKKDSTKAPTSFDNPELRAEALRDAEAMARMGELGESASERALRELSKEKRAEIQKLRDVAAGTKPAGSLTATSKPSELDLNLFKVQRKEPSESVIVYGREKGRTLVTGARKRRPEEKD